MQANFPPKGALVGLLISTVNFIYEIFVPGRDIDKEPGKTEKETPTPTQQPQSQQ